MKLFSYKVKGDKYITGIPIIKNPIKIHYIVIFVVNR